MHIWRSIAYSDGTESNAGAVEKTTVWGVSGRFPARGGRMLCGAAFRGADGRRPVLWSLGKARLFGTARAYGAALPDCQRAQSGAYSGCSITGIGFSGGCGARVHRLAARYDRTQPDAAGFRGLEAGLRRGGAERLRHLPVTGGADAAERLLDHWCDELCFAACAAARILGAAACDARRETRLGTDQRVRTAFRADG